MIHHDRQLMDQNGQMPQLKVQMNHQRPLLIHLSLLLRESNPAADLPGRSDDSAGRSAFVSRAVG